MKTKVVVDTNSVNNTGIGNKIFGQRKELYSLIEIIELFVPEIVIKEIKEHKRKSFYNKRQELINNDLFKIVDGNKEKYLKLDIQSIIKKDFDSEDIPYTIVQTGDIADFFEKFEDALIKNLPPFGTSSDKGIKDAMIANSVDSLLKTLDSEEKIILVTKDGRLKEYYEKDTRVRTTDSITGVKDLLEHDKGVTTKTDGIIKIGFTGIRDKSELERKIDKMLTNFRNSISFQKTHEFIDILNKNKTFLTKENKADIIRSALSNDQIKWIIKDQDIYDFLVPLYYECSDSLTEHEQFEFEALVGINYNFTFSDSDEH